MAEGGCCGCGCAGRSGRYAAIDEGTIRRLVTEFYAKVRKDPLLGPVFEGAIGNWDGHLAKMVDFWASATQGAGRYSGNMMAAHLKLPDIGREHFARWLALFTQEVDRLFEPGAGKPFMDVATRLADRLQHAVVERDWSELARHQIEATGRVSGNVALALAKRDGP